MKDRYFLDTNILVYTFDSSSPKKQAVAIELVRNALEKRCGIISYQVVQEFINVALRKFSKPMSTLDAGFYLTKVLQPLCEVFPDINLYSQALIIKEEISCSFYDALIISSAQAGDCKILYSEDLQDSVVIRNIRIENPFS